MLSFIHFQQLSVHALECILETVSLCHGYLATEISCIAAKEIFLETDECECWLPEECVPIYAELFILFYFQ